MKFKIVFNNSGDEITYTSVNSDFLQFYVDWINKNHLNNFFAPRDFGKKIKQNIEFLHNSIVKYKQLGIDKVSNVDYEVLDHNQYLDQTVLNEYHARWAKSHWLEIDILALRKQSNKIPIVKKICDRLSDDIERLTLNGVLETIGLREVHEDINMGIHYIEAMFSKIIECSSKIRKFDENPYGKEILNHNTANLQLTGHHLGRTLHNKFLYWDDKIEADDENTFNQISHCVNFSFNRPQTLPMSLEYIQWCNNNGRQPIGENLNLGNIPDLADKVLYYREVAYRNFLCNNSFKIVI